MASGTSGHNMDAFQTYDRSKDDEVGDQNKFYSQPKSKYTFFSALNKLDKYL